MAWIGTAIGGAIGGLGSMYSANSAANASAGANDKTAEIAYATNAFNADQATLNRQFQTDMSNTSYQRATADLAAAGLNPMLSMIKGGESTPAGATASGVMPTIQPVNRNAFGASLTGALNGASQAASIAKTKQDTNTAAAEETAAKARATQSLASAGQLDATRDQIRQDMTAFETRLKQLEWNAILTKWAAGEKMSDAETARMRADWAPNFYAAQATEIKNKAELVGLQVPEAIANAAFWNSTFGKAQPFISHAVGDAAAAAGAVYGVGKGIGGAKGNTNFNTTVNNLPR